MTTSTDLELVHPHVVRSSACGWPAARVTPPGCWPSYATIAVEGCELPLHQAQFALGHASISTTEDYTHDRFGAKVNDAVVAQLLD